MRDDLIEGQEVLRLDDLERLEMMAVQLNEVSAFLVRESVSYARLAFILLDNAAEVIMRRNIEARLTHNKTMERVLRQWKEILERDPADAEARRHRDEVAREVVPRSARKELARSFDAKVDFIRDQRLGLDAGVVGDDDGGRVAAQSGDDELADGAGVAGQRHGGVLMDLGRLWGPGRSSVTVL